MEKEYVPYGEEWKKEISKLRKDLIIDMLAKKGEEGFALREEITRLKIEVIQLSELLKVKQ